VTDLLVVDASAILVTLLEQGERAAAVARRCAAAALVAPDLIGYEVLNVLRRRRAAGRFSDADARRAVEAWRASPVELWPLRSFDDRLWELTGAMSAYDAAYVALAERLDAPLLTADARLSRAPGVRAEVVLV
jgi:predicted nucleic acid-binding protein